jgi:hypothetical protein
MMNILSSNAATASDSFNEDPRLEGEDNLAWLGRNLPPGDVTHLAMVGGVDRTSFRLRVAQSHLREDLSPGHWSHVFMLGEIGTAIGSTRVFEVSLDPPGGFGFPPPTNGVQEGRLDRYSDPAQYPNIAVCGVPVARSEVEKALSRFRKQRGVLDAVDLVLRWLAFAWGASRSGNPLLEGQGIPSAAMLEVVMGAVGFDLTPGLESRASCPEAIWQAAKWWHEYYKRDKRLPMSGAFWISHKL